jgi:8-oxo-dGTP pyrophosphatase MutT (NUDIX family)
MCTAVRELKEELGLDAKKAERLYHCDCSSKNSYEKVSLITTDQDPKISNREIADWIWWDPAGSEDVAPYVRNIWRRYQGGPHDPRRGSAA